MIDKHSYEQVHLKSFLYEFLNSGDPLYLDPLYLTDDSFADIRELKQTDAANLTCNVQPSKC